MSALKLALTQFFTAFTVLAACLEAIAQMFLNFASVGKEESGAYLDASRHERAVAMAKLNAELITK